MSIRLYMDVNVHGAITSGLRQRGVDVLTAQEDNASETPDSELLDRATYLGRVLFTMDKDFLEEAARRQQTGEPFAGIIFAHQRNATIAQCLDDLELIATAGAPDEFANRLEYLPL